MRPTPEQKLLKLLAARDAAIAKSMARIDKKWAEAILRVRKAIAAKGCAHPSEAVTEFKWEWDNGYGVQRTKTGLHCSICNAKQMWPLISSIWSEERHLG